MLFEQITGAARDAVRHTGRELVIAAVAGILGAIALGFTTAAIYLALARAVGSIGACLVVAGIYLAGALLVYLLTRGSRPSPPPPRRPPEREGLDPDAVSHLIATFLAGVRAGREGFGRKRR